MGYEFHRLIMNAGYEQEALRGRWGILQIP
jgi:hypothetical protein